MITMIFGAGASAGSGLCQPKNPPLGKDLFDALVELNGCFTGLESNTQDIFRSEGFESGMAEVQNNSKVINSLQKELACYLSSFSITNENAYVRLFNKLTSNLDDINIVTLNYDMLIEQAIWSMDLSVDYNGNGAGVNVLKPHGSSNFLPRLPPGVEMSNINITNCTGSFVGGLKTSAVTTHEQVITWCDDPKNNALSPVLSMYNKDKRIVVNSNVIERAKQKYVEFVNESKVIVLIGIKYIPHDGHIWDSLTASNAPIIVVDPYPALTLNWAQQHNKENVTIINKGFSEAVWSITKLVRAYL